MILRRSPTLVRAELRATDDRIDAGYWRFSRSTRGALASRAEYQRRETLRAELAASKEAMRAWRIEKRLAGKMTREGAEETKR